MQNQTRKVKIKLVTASNHELALREIAHLLGGKAETELYNFNSGERRYDKRTLERILEALLQNQADLYFFTVRELDRLRSFQIADELKKNGLKTIAGGTFAYANVQETLNHFDTAVVGDARHAIERALAGESGVIYGGIAEPSIESYDVPLFYLEGGKILKSETGVKPFRHPQYKESKELSFTTMRGCSYSCPYCEVSQLREAFPDYRLRKKPLGQVLSYIGEKAREIKPDYIYIWDEDFLLHSDSEIDTFIEFYGKIKLPFFIFATPKTAIHGKHKLEKLLNVGLDQVNLGIQSGSERIQKGLFERKESLEEGREAVKILADLCKANSASVKPPMVDFITLNPYETQEDIIASIKHVLGLPRPFNLVTHIMNFFEGTPLKHDAMQRGLIRDDYSFDHDLHDFASHAKDAMAGRRKSSVEHIYLSSILFRMRGVHDGDRCGMITRSDAEALLSKPAMQYHCENADALIEEMDKKYSPCTRRYLDM